jgi:hypothetical protein
MVLRVHELRSHGHWKAVWDSRSHDGDEVYCSTLFAFLQNIYKSNAVCPSRIRSVLRVLSRASQSDTRSIMQGGAAVPLSAAEGNAVVVGVR